MRAVCELFGLSTDASHGFARGCGDTGGSESLVRLCGGALGVLGRWTSTQRLMEW